MSSPEYTRYLGLLEIVGAGHSDFAAFLQHLGRCLPGVIPMDFLALALYDSARRVIRLHHVHASGSGDVHGGIELPLAETPDVFVWESGEPLLLEDLTAESRWPRVIGPMKDEGIQSCCFVPLRAGERNLGSLIVASERHGAYRKEDIEWLQQIGRQVAVAVDHALNRESAWRSKQEADRQRDRLRLLLRISNALVSKLNLPELLRTVSTIMREVVHQEYVCLLLYDETRRQLRLVALDAPDDSEFLPKGYVAEIADSPGERALQTKRPVVIQRLNELRQFGHDVIRMLVSQGFQSVCALPLLSGERAIGCLNLASRQEQAFPESDVEFLTQVAGQVTLAMENALAHQEITQLKNKLAEEKLYLQEEVRTERGFEAIIGDSQALKHVLDQITIVAPTDSTVLIQGETGTGKELIARAIHQLSGRKERTFVKLNCASIPSGLLESELFGHERGAFTGAISHKTGRFELADNGTIFLDEVGDIPLELQSKLLRVLQEQEFERLGGTKTIRVNVRLIAATNRDLKNLVDAKEFRSDLYYRLNVFPVTMPPLRERRDDIPRLVRYFTQQHAVRMKKHIDTVPADTLEALSRYDWPGNVRELENLVERSVILTQGTELQVPLSELQADNGRKIAATQTLRESEREQIVRTLRHVNWRIGGPTGAAAKLGLKRTTLTSKMKKLGIARPLQ
ncbi:MAG: sigma 54-interacting transcriptional regulator [Nitrospiraceae bacterium]